MSASAPPVAPLGTAAAAAPAAPVLDRPIAEPRYRWVAHPVYDTLFFIFPTLFAAIFVSFQFAFAHNDRIYNAMMAFVLTFGMAHAGGTPFFFLDSLNMQNYLRRGFWFFVMPFFIVGLASVLAYNHLVWHVLVITNGFQFYHLTRQNVGMIGFYRNKQGLNTPELRSIDNRFIYSTALFFYLFAWVNWPSQLPFRSALPYLQLAMPAILLWMGYEMFRTLRTHLLGTWRQRGAAAWPYFGMIVSSASFPVVTAVLTLLIPKPLNLTEAMAGKWLWASLSYALVAHYIQYISLLILLNLHKYPAGQKPAAPDGFEPQPMFKSWRLNGAVLLVGFMLIYVGLNQALAYGAEGKSWHWLAAGILTGLTWCHFYWDGLIWAMKHEFNRKTILPYLKPLK